jgi:hypothetical protein
MVSADGDKRFASRSYKCIFANRGLVMESAPASINILRAPYPKSGGKNVRRELSAIMSCSKSSIKAGNVET